MELEHGRAEIIVVDDRIELRLEGSFNREGVLKYQRKYREIVLGFKLLPFKVLVDGTGVVGATPGAFEEIDNFNGWLNTQKLLAKAMVVNSEALKEIMISRTPEQNRQKMRIFSNRQQALLWLDSV